MNPKGDCARPRRNYNKDQALPLPLGGPDSSARLGRDLCGGSDRLEEGLKDAKAAREKRLARKLLFMEREFVLLLPRLRP